MVSLKHAYNSAKADSTDPTIVRPSAWNAEHNFITAADGVVLGRAAGAGPGAVTEITNAALGAAILPVGVMLPYGGATAPAGFLLCNGQTVSRTTYAALFAVLGTTWGAGDGTSTFTLPNLGATVLAGAGAGWALGQYQGSNTNRQPRHYGNVNVNVNVYGEAWSDGVNFYYAVGLGSAGSGSGAGSNFVTSGNAPNVYTKLSSSGSGNGTIANDGNNLTDPISIVQATAVVNYIIKT